MTASSSRFSKPFVTFPIVLRDSADLFPEGRRREETGKAILPSRLSGHEFPVECAMPIEGEDGS